LPVSYRQHIVDDAVERTGRRPVPAARSVSWISPPEPGCTRSISSNMHPASSAVAGRMR
jgi:hypothetical protein